jgi:hypothetical protein
MANKSQQKQNVQQPQKSNEQKAEELRQKVAEGTTKPIPTAENTPPEEKAELDKKTVKMAKEQNAKHEETRKKLEELKKQYDAAKAEEKAEKEAEKNEKKALKDAALAERTKKQALLDEADEKIVRAKRDLEATEEWAVLTAALKAREEIGPLPKVPKGGGGAPRASGGGRKASNGLTSKMVKILGVMTPGVRYGSAALAELTGILKGKPFPLMEEMGLLEVEIPQEGEGRGKRFLITEKGREELEKALNEDE